MRSAWPSPASARNAPIWCWRAAPFWKPCSRCGRANACAWPTADCVRAFSPRSWPRTASIGANAAPGIGGARASGMRNTRRGGSGGGRRQLKVRLKTARQRTASSQRWLERQLNDPYVAAAKREGYRSRAAYKLIEIDDRHHLLKPGARVIDLGATPGGWAQVAAQRVRSTEGKGQVAAIDLLPMEALAGVEFLLLDFLDPVAPARLRDLLSGGRADVVLSDMAAQGTGHARTDHLRVMALAEAAAEFACEVLKPGGAFLCKVFQGGTEQALLGRLKRTFSSVRHVKPPASRTASAELYVLATGLRPSEQAGAEGARGERG